jgi:HD-GYP domain-containing protein (c-di-GMP phosphodiesterase class II)
VTESTPDPQLAVQELIDELVSALMNARVYFAAHPRVQLSIEQLTRAVQALCQATRQRTLRLATAGGYVLFDNRPIVGASLAAGRLIEILGRLGSGGLEITAQCTADDIRALVEALSARNLEADAYAKTNAWLKPRVADRVRLLPPFRADSTGGHGGGTGDDLLATGEGSLGVDEKRDSAVELPTRLYQGVLGLLQDVTVSVCQGGTIELGAVQTEAERLLKQLDQAPGPLIGLSTRHEYDAFTLGHSLRVTVLAMDFARTLQATPQMMMRVGVAGLLHDVGKALVPFEILHSRRPLTNEERDVVNTHPEHGARILLDHKQIDGLAIAAAFGHHRRADGQGYPKTVHQYHASMTTKIVKICDVYEALTAARPYKPPMSPVRAYRVMMSMKGHFDPALLHRFVHYNGVFATGSTVKLDSGERAFVLEQSRELLLPRVLVVTDRDGNELDWQTRRPLDLSEPGLGIAVTGTESNAAPTPQSEQPGVPETVVAGCCGPTIAVPPEPAAAPTK